jgi:hypothetical protein
MAVKEKRVFMTNTTKQFLFCIEANRYPTTRTKVLELNNITFTERSQSVHFIYRDPDPEIQQFLLVNLH